MAPLTFILISGAVSGLALGFFLKAVEYSFGDLVYTLLLNVDFIPVINQVIWPEWMEFLFHLIVSFFIAAGYFLLLKRWDRPVLLAFLVTIPAVFLYFPLSVLARKTVPAVDDISAIAWWTAGHLLYAVLLGLFGKKMKRKA